MKEYLCHECAEKDYKLNIFIPTNFTGSIGKLEKFIKHTTPIKFENGLHSVFLSSDYEDYKDYIVNSICSGSVEIINKKIINVVWYAGKETGFSYLDGNLIEPPDAVKVVLFLDEHKIHAYPTGSLDLKQSICEKCRKPIINLE